MVNEDKQQPVLLIDAGNSSVKWRLSTAMNQSNISNNTYPENITESFFVDSWKSIEKPAKIFVTCVANDLVWQLLDKACQQLWSIKAVRITATAEEFGLINAYEEPSTLGSDRWCAMIGAYIEIESDFIVVDCGSAITIDVVRRSEKHRVANHLGGYILPGVTMMKNSLGAQTADVKVDTEITHSSVITPANTTTGCVNAAVYLAAVKLIETVFEQQSKKLINLQCVLTGGDANLVAELLSIKYVMMPDVVLRGLAYIARSQIESNN